MYRGLYSIWSLVILLMSILIFCISSVGFSVITTKHAELINTHRNIKISIKNIDYKINKGFIQFKFSNIKLIHQRENSSVNAVSNVTVKFNLFASPKIHVEVNDIAANEILDFLQNKIFQTNYTAQIDSVNKDIITSNLLIFLNKNYIKNFRLDLKFKGFDVKNMKEYNQNPFLQKNKITIQNITISTPNKKTYYIGDVLCNYTLNGNNNNISGLILRQKSAEKNNELKIGSKFINNTTFNIEFYGYLQHIIAITQGYNLSLNDFSKISLSYNVRHKDIMFDVSVNGLKFQSEVLKNVYAKNVAFNGRYDVLRHIFIVKKFNLDLLHNLKKIDVSGNMYLAKNDVFEINLKSNSLFDSQLVYQYWPNHKNTLHLKNLLQNLVVGGEIDGVQLQIKKSLKNSINKPLLKFNLEFNVFKAIVRKFLNDKKYTIDSPLVSVQINLNDVLINAKNATLNKIVSTKNLFIDIPLKLNNKNDTSVNFEVDSPVQNIQAFLESQNIKTGKISLLNGNINCSINAKIPHSNGQNLIISGSAKENKMSVLYNNDKHNIILKNTTFNINKKIIKITTDIRYNDILMKNLKVITFFSKQLKIDNLAFNLPINQPRIKQILHNLPLYGSVDFNIQKMNKFHLDLYKLGIENNPLLIEKNTNTQASLDFSLDNENTTNITLNDIKIQLPQVSASGSLTLDASNKSLIKTSVEVKNFHNNQFDFNYSKSNSGRMHHYDVRATKIDIAEINKIIKNFQKHPQYFNTTYSNTKNHIINIESDVLYESTKLMVEKLKLNLELTNGIVHKINAEAYGPKNSGYMRVFFDTPITAIIINNTGMFLKAFGNTRSLHKGNFAMYGSINHDMQFDGDLYMYNFQLLESYLLSTILRIYALSGLSIKNIFSFLSNGISFSDMHCDASINKRFVLLKSCQAFSDAMLMSADAMVEFSEKSGEIQGMIIPKSFFNTPIIFLQRMLSRNHKTLLDTFEGHQNFSITWQESKKPIIKANPMSFMLPSVFTHLFSQKKTIQTNDKHLEQKKTQLTQ